MHSLLRYSAVSVVMIFIYSGCNYNPGPNNLGPGKTVPPKAGTVYVYNNTPIDTNGVKLTDSAYMSVDSVANSDTTYSGKSNVIVMNSRNLKTGLNSQTYIHYEDNGDISEYVGGSLLTFFGISLPDWVTYPSQSHLSSGAKLYDDTIKILPVPIHLVVNDSITYTNWTTFSLANSTLDVYNMKHQVYYNGEIIILPGFPGIPISTNEITTLSFAPSIGYYADRTSQPVKVPQGLFQSFQGLEKTLVSYNLK